MDKERLQEFQNKFDEQYNRFASAVQDKMAELESVDDPIVKAQIESEIDDLYDQELDALEDAQDQMTDLMEDENDTGILDKVKAKFSDYYEEIKKRFE